MVGLFLNNMNDPFARMEPEQNLVDSTHFDGTKAFDTMGFSDGAGVASGRAGTQEVDGNKLDEKELVREKREKRDKTNELIELGYQLRQSRAESVTVGGISLSIGEWQDIRDTLNDPAKLALVREQMRAEGKTDAEIAESEYIAKKAADIAIKRYQGEPLTPEEQAFEQRLENNPAAQQHVEDFAKANKVTIDRQLESDLSLGEVQYAEIADLESDTAREVFAVKVVQDSDSIEVAEASRQSASFGNENPFASAYTPSADFNASASGVQIAAVAPDVTVESGAKPIGLAHG